MAENDKWDAKTGKPGSDGVPDSATDKIKLAQWATTQGPAGNAQAPVSTDGVPAPATGAPQTTTTTGGLPQIPGYTSPADSGKPILFGYDAGAEERAVFSNTKYANLENPQVKDDVLAAAKAQNKNFDIATDPDQTLERAAAIANNLGATVEQVLKAMARGEFKPDAGGYGSSAGPYKQVDRRVQLTDPGTARRVINTALANFLGREASDDDVNEFTAALNAMERKNPQVTTTSGYRSATGSSQSQSTVAGGGFDVSDFADRYAKAQKGSAEHQAATTYMDALIDGIKDPMRLV